MVAPSTRIALAALLTALCTSQAYGNPICATRDALHDGLRAKWHESPIWRGFVENEDDALSRLFEVWLSPEGTWSIVTVFADGRACIMASGQLGRTYALEPQGEDG